MANLDAKNISRRNVLKFGAGAIAASMIGLEGIMGFQPALAQGASDIDVLNYALTLEHLEYAFYRDGLNKLSRFTAISGDTIERGYFESIRNHEKTHVDTLTSVIQKLGGTPVGELQYSFPYTTAFSFLKVAALLENTGVSAYDGAVTLIKDPGLLTAAATIATVEARHASFLNFITGASPFPSAFDTPKSQAEILAAAGGFIVK